jgi:hypothetical protein
MKRGVKGDGPKEMDAGCDESGRPLVLRRKEKMDLTSSAPSSEELSARQLREC